ncbi:MAG: DUF4252 domain-containing protein [Melioribacteraceae bacterium]|nr:DUF4252 domain-containing protein [Melioribacteraceae bacterium]
MKTIVKSLLAFVFFTAISVNAQQVDYTKMSGFFNFGDMTQIAKSEPVTEVLVEEPLLKMAAKMAGDEEGMNEMLNALKVVKVVEYELTINNKHDFESKVVDLDKTLLNNKWERIVKSKSKGGSANVYMKSDGKGNYSGMAVMALGMNGKVTFVNVVGDINLDTIGKISTQFNIDSLKGMGNKKKDNE